MLLTAGKLIGKLSLVLIDSQRMEQFIYIQRLITEIGSHLYILLCDEPTGALDYNTSKEILKLIETVNQKYGNTIVMVTHNDAIKDMADRVVKLRDGMIRKNYLNEHKIPAAELDW